MGTTKTYGLGGGVAGTTELDANLDGAVLIEDSAGADFFEIDTANERLLLAGGGAKTSTGGQPPMCADGGLHIGLGDSGISSVSNEQDALVIEGGDTHTGMCIVTSGSSYNTKIAFGRDGAPTAGAVTYGNGTNAMGLVTNGTNRVTIDNAGDTTLETGSFKVKRTSGGVSDVDIAFANVANTGFYAAANNILDVAVDGTNIASFKNDRGLRMKQGSIALHKGTASDTTTSSPMYLKDTNATLVIRLNKGNVGNVTVAANITAIEFHRKPEDGEVVTFMAHFTKSADSTPRTIDYTASAVSVHSAEGSSAVTGEIYWSGGVPHTMSTGNGAIDIVQFTCMPVGSTFNIYASVIGQGFAVAT